MNVSIKSYALPTILYFLLAGHMVNPVVTTDDDIAEPGPGTVSLRSALRTADSGDTITFSQDLDGKTITLTLVDQPRSILKGEVMGMREEASGLVSYLVGYFDRDYGHSALYAKKDITVDASALPHGITIEWARDADTHARVMGIYGNLTLKNVTIRGGESVAEDISAINPDQPWSLARGAGLAVWGRLVLEECTIYDNHCVSEDFLQSRDRGAFGGGIYADIVEIHNSVISGNSVTGLGAAGGGIYSVGGAESELERSLVERSVISGNKISGLFTYGGGLFSDGGSIGNSKQIQLINCTLSKNLVEPLMGLPPFLQTMGYWRGGAMYMSNGALQVQGSTIVDNEVYGFPRTGDLDKTNLAGGIAATIGNAHAVESMTLAQNIITGNTVTEVDGSGQAVRSYSEDIFSGSLVHFKSNGYNLTGNVNFDQILVPVGIPNWRSLARKHFPQPGDAVDVVFDDVIEYGVFSDDILSVGVDSGSPVPLYFIPKDKAVDQVPHLYSITEQYLEYTSAQGSSDTFLDIVLSRLETVYTLDGFKDSFIEDFELFLSTVDIDDTLEGLQPYTDPSGSPILTLEDTLWFGPEETWPSETANYSYIQFWHRLDGALKLQPISGMGGELINDTTWANLFPEGVLAENLSISVQHYPETILVRLSPHDQLGNSRNGDFWGDIGSIEK